MGEKMKKIVLVAAMFLACAGVATGSSLNGDYKGNPIVIVKSDGKQLETDEVPAMIYDGHTVVPISLLRQIGASVTWDQNNYSVNVSLPQASYTTTPDVDKFIEEFGNKGENIIYAAQYFTIGKGMGQLQFNLNFNTTDASKQKEYNDLMNAVVATSAMQMKMVYPDGPSSFIFTQDTRDYWSGKIDKDEYIKRIKIVDNNLPPIQSQPTPTTGSVIDSQIDGDFDGFESDKIFKLTNGQIWQQTSIDYYYHYSFMPKVTIYKDGTTYKMIVDGVDKKITVQQLK